METIRVLLILGFMIFLTIIIAVIYQEDKKRYEEELKYREEKLKLLERIDTRLFSIELEDYVRKEQRKCRSNKNDTRTKTK